MMGSVSARGVFRALSNTYDGAFFAKILAVPYLLNFLSKSSILAV